MVQSTTTTTEAPAAGITPVADNASANATATVTNTEIVAAEEEQEAPQGGSPYGSILMLVAIVVIFYFFIIRPQRKRQKESQKFRDALSKGSKVLTAGGIHGTIVEISDKNSSVLLEIAPGTRIRIEKSMLYPSAEDAQADATNAINADKK